MKKITLNELRSIIKQIIKEELNEGIHDLNILSRPLSNPDIKYKERTPEEDSNDLDKRSENILRMRYRQQIADPKISDKELKFILSGKGDTRFGGRPNAIRNIINNRRSSQPHKKE